MFSARPEYHSGYKMHSVESLDAVQGMEWSLGIRLLPCRALPTSIFDEL